MDHGAPRGALRLLASLLRVAGVLLLAAVLLAAAAGVYLRWALDAQQVKALAVEQLAALLGREVSIESLDLAPRGVRVRGLRVRGARPGAADLLSCGSALVTVRLAPLLRRRLEFGAVRLESPRISLTRDAAGAWSVADLFGSSDAASGAGRGGLPLALAAAETVVEDGVLLVDDRLRGRRIALQGLRLSVRGFDADQPFPVEASFLSEARLGARSLRTQVAVAGRVDLAGLRLSSATAALSLLRVEAGGAVVSGQARVWDFTSPRVEAEIFAPPLGPAVWRRLLGRDVPLSLPAVRWAVRAAWPAPGLLDLEKLAAATPAGSFSATGVFDAAAAEPTLSLEASAHDADLGRAAAWYAPWAGRGIAGRADGRLSVTGWPGRLQAREGALTLRGFGAAWNGRRVRDLSLDASAGDEFSRAQVSVSSGHVEALGSSFDDLSVALSVKDQDLSVERFALNWEGARVRLRARVARLSAPKEVLLSGSVDALSWERAQRLVETARAEISTRPAGAPEAERRPWVSLFKYAIPRGFPDTAGHLRVGEVTHANFWCRDVDLIWSLKGVTPALDRVSGEGRLSFGPGRVKDIPAVQDANAFLRVVFLPFVYMHRMNSLSVFSTATAYPKTLDFDRIEGEYGVTRGVAVTRYFHVDSGQLAAYAEGSADFGRERVEMDILTRLSGFRGALPEWWVDESGRPAIGFRVAGDLGRPDLQPRLRKIGAGEMEAKVEEGRSRARRRYEALEKLRTL
ncbi:MAG: AsmA family protein [Elusimicrobia bacterium]|nr:AsmA family protein [Elusimicrobiota bacterium]